MIPLPQELLPYQKQGEELLKDGHIHGLEFAGRTYQVNVFDPNVHEAYWVFLHLTEQGELSDSFCVCSDETENDRCAHMAASFLKIYNYRQEPLHKRYEASFWRILGLIFSERTLSKAQLKSTIKSKNESGVQFLKELFEKTVPPTEETSLKFSDLSEDELSEIRSGHLTEVQKYEFSFWSDLAKSLLLIQENKKPYKVDFSEDKSGLPLLLKVETEDLELSISLKQDELLKLIPYLATIECELKMRGGFKDRVEKIDFDPIHGQLRLALTSFDPKSLTGKKVGGWIYQPHQGFFRIEGDPLLLNTLVPNDQVALFLSKYHAKLAPPLLNPGVYELKGFLEFDKRGSLHITHALFHPHDLEDPQSWRFGNWVALKDRGFFKVLRSKHLPKTEKIGKDKVYDWVITHQGYLNGIDGFHVHLKSLESTVTWDVTERGGLVFFSGLKGDFLIAPKEYGQLVYAPGLGFFSKSSFEEALSIPSGEEISPYNVPGYIRQNEDELKLIPDFFMKKNPIDRATLDISLVKGKIVSHPNIELLPEFKDFKIKFYDDFLFVEKHGFFHLSDKHFVPLEWREEKIIPEAHWEGFFEKTLTKLQPHIRNIDPKLLPPPKMALKYEETLFFESTLGRISFETFLKAFKTGKRFFLSDIGRFDLSEKRFQALGDMFKKSRYPAMTLLDLYKLNALEEMHLDLSRFTKSPPMDLSGFKSQLRPYQEVGVKWLWFLYANQMSGLLCDDMGLGKTHQTMGLMAAIRNSMENGRGAKFLVVCPTSVLYHWQEKLEAFLPGIKITVFHGLNRTLSDFKEEEGVLLTSYGILRNEIKQFKEMQFDLAIYDEIQLAKNHLSRLWRSLREIKASMVLGLTGTPIENHLKELKALFDICLPPLMPSEADFIRLFIKPIERNESTAAKALLQRTIAPFLLRRRKEEVLHDLPEKIEEISHTDMSPSQQRLYHEVYMNAKSGVIQDLLDDKKIVPYIHIFALLSSLKKICDHPALYLKDIENYKKYHSGKWELFLELLSEALGSDQKVVVFSHFLGMLDIIEMHLKESGIGYASLRGSTPNRREMIDRFQNDSSCKVFVASLQAGGLGIDLTEASVVIHYDRWWNAARENQATDRVHRIGQKKGVQVFKLVTVDSVEERIHDLIEKKNKRMEEIVGSDETQVIKNLSRQELIQLLQEEDAAHS